MSIDKFALPRGIPEEQGVSPQSILDFLAGVQRLANGPIEQELHGLMILRHGKVVAEGVFAPYRAEQARKLFSLSKSFTATAIGLAAQEGLLSLDDAVVSFFPKEAPARIPPNLAAMRVRHLLGMSTGHAEDTIAPLFENGPDWRATFLAQPVVYPPGTHFVYNSGASYMLSAIIQKRTGLRLRDYLVPRLFEPLGIDPPEWETCPTGEDAGGWGLRLNMEEIAKFGQLYLQDGVWQGKRLLPQGWVEDASLAQISNGKNPHHDWEQGYGYQFWRCKYPTAYRADGAYGQFCLIIPEKDAVIVMTCAVANEVGQPMLDLAWDHLLSGMSETTLAPDERARQAMNEALERLQVPAPVRPSAHPYIWAGRETLYRIRPNAAACAAIKLVFAPGGCALTLQDEGGNCEIFYSLDGWRDSITSFPRGFAPQYGYTAWPGDAVPRGERILVSAACWWEDESTFVLETRFPDTPFRFTTKCAFPKDMIVLRSEANVFFQPTASVIMVGDIARIEGV